MIRSTCRPAPWGGLLTLRESGMRAEVETSHDCYVVTDSMVRHLRHKGSAELRHSIECCACDVCMCYRKLLEIRSYLKRLADNEGE